MIRGFSLWLDFLRLSAALLVLMGHVAHQRFTDGAIVELRTWNVASDAVVVFFVLSGVVIAYATERDGTAGRFAFNRLTRLWSVMIPAVLITLLFDRIGLSINPEAYPLDYYWPLPPSDLLLRSLTFTNQWQGIWDWVRPGTNGPLWSLSYEAAYYTLFAIVVFARGALRLLLATLVVVLAGLPILLLLPAWVLGVWVWNIVRSRKVALSPVAAMLCAVGAPVVAVLAKAMGVHTTLLAATEALLPPGTVQRAMVYSDEVLWNSILALLVALHLIGVFALARRPRPWKLPDRVARAVRWSAGASFSLYVTHYPVLHLMDAVLPEDLRAKVAVFFVGPILFAVLFAAVFERPLPRIRAALSNAMPSWNHGPPRS